MADRWLDVYDRLKTFISANNNIEISSGSVCIPGEVRPGFYQLFDEVGNEFVNGHFPGELKIAHRLSEKWQELSEQITHELGLLSIDLPLDVKWFLADPLDGLARALFDILFDVLKGKATVEEFEQRAVDLVKDQFTRYYRDGYRRWSIIALIHILAPDDLLEVKGQDIYNDINLADSGGGIGTPLSELPEPEPTRTISFVEAPVNAFLAPKIIVHSSRLEAFVSLRPDYHESSWNSRVYSENQQWLDIPPELYKRDKVWLWPDMVLHTAKNVRDLKLIADYSRVAKPDLNIEFRETSDWYTKEGLEDVLIHAETLKPKCGSFVACLEPVPENARQELEQLNSSVTDTGISDSEREKTSTICLLHVDYEPERLEPLVEALAQK